MPKPDYHSLDLPAPPDDRPSVLLNMIMSVDGKVTVEGTEQGIGTKVDQRLMRELRANADVVLDGANTVRASGASSRLNDTALEELRVARGQSRLPIASTITRSGNLPLDGAFFTGDDFEAVVYASSSMMPDRRSALEATGRRVVEVPAGNEVRSMLKHMRKELGAKVLVAEGGPSVNANLFAENAVDEFFITVGPVVVGGEDALTPVTGFPRLRHDLIHLELLAAVPNEETSEVYLRYRINRSR